MVPFLNRLDALLSRQPLLVRWLSGVGGALCLVTASGLVRSAIPVPILPYLLFVPAVMASGFFAGTVSSIAAVMFSTIAAIVFFIPSDVHSFPQQLSIVLYVGVTLGIAMVCSVLRTSLLSIERSTNELQEQIAAALAAQTRIEETLRQSQKMEAVGQLTGGIAHDFNNMLAAISGSIELMRKNVTRQQYGKLPRYLDTVEHAAASTADLTNRLLAFSRGQRLDPKMLDLGTLVEGFEPILRRSLPTVQIKIECD